MSTYVKTFIQAKIAETVQQTQYVSDGVSSIIDKFTATNFGTVTTTLSVHIVPNAGSPGTSNQIVRTKSIQPNETYTFPELVGQLLSPGDSINTIAGAATLTIRSSGRTVTQ